MTIQTTNRRPSERGAVLIVVMLVMMGLLGLGITALWLTSTNMQVGGNMNMRQQALYVAEAGLERAQAVLNAPVAPNMNQLLAGTNPGQDNVPTGLDANGLPNGIGAVMMDGGAALNGIVFPPASFGRTAGAANAPTTATMGAYTVWIRNDTAEIRQGAAFYAADGGNQTVVVRSRGVALDNRTTVILEVAMIPGSSGNAGPGAAGQIPPSLCYAGKNACDDNSSTVAGMEVVGP